LPTLSSCVPPDEAGFPALPLACGLHLGQRRSGPSCPWRSTGGGRRVNAIGAFGFLATSPAGRRLAHYLFKGSGRAGVSPGERSAHEHPGGSGTRGLCQESRCGGAGQPRASSWAVRDCGCAEAGALEAAGIELYSPAAPTARSWNPIGRFEAYQA